MDRIHYVTKELDPHRDRVRRGRKDFDHVPAGPKGAPMEVRVIARILDLHKLGENLLPPDFFPLFQIEQHSVIDLWRAQAVDAGDRADDDHIVPLQERPRGRVPHLINRIVDRGIFRDVGVGLREIGLGLVVIVVAHEILDRVMGEELPEFLIQLSSQCLVVDQHQRGFLGSLDQVRHREGLAGAGHPQQCLMLPAGLHPGGELLNRLALIPAGREGGFELERSHGGHLTTGLRTPFMFPS